MGATASKKYRRYRRLLTRAWTATAPQTIRPGDIIKIKLQDADGDWANHWALCDHIDQFGHVYCYHVVTDDRDLDKDVTRRALVRYETLERIIYSKGHHSSAEPARYRVANQRRLARKVLWTVGRQVPEWQDLAADLEQLPGQYVDYHWKTRNEEHYCTHWRYAIGWSTDVYTDHQIVDKTIDQMAILTRRTTAKEVAG
ncbi:unnamed protein product [Medioppia subpectinata]|uniref:Uncharacterized protein n=1 Tax=Medioppia subpectinata TaxID=1979941 RepID=A0A7R9KQ12_9ACAR|nr:unnamed protein product [Medioppia subpectinata]CAG2107674.1 unnamed protein product [Medioppia subpectinata]